MKHLLAILLAVISMTSYAQKDFFTQTDEFMSMYVKDGRVDYAMISEFQLNNVLEAGEAWYNLERTDAERKAYMINRYNLLVIKGVIRRGIPASVQDDGQFFETKEFIHNGEKVSLNILEKEILFKEFPDARLHFALVCGAIGCPPLISEAFRPETLEAQLDAVTTAAMSNLNVIQYGAVSNEISWSAIFDWYAKDFGGSKAARLEWINSFRTSPLPTDARISTIPYDWNLNGMASTNVGTADGDPGQANNAIRYVVSSTIPKGSTETKIFNNLYTQATGDGTTLQNRDNFFTTLITSLYGVSDRFNAGVEIRFRQYTNFAFPASPFENFGGNARNSRSEIATIGPKIRWAPVPKWSNFSIQSALWIPLRNDLEGTAESPYVDWNKPTLFTQIFNDFPLGSSFSLFTELDIFWEDIGREEADFNKFTTPATVILSYFPEPNTTIYALNGFAPTWSPDLDYFYQGGLGAKYQFSRKFEVEALYTYFTNSFLQENNGRAATINFGIRINT
ncbi:DUF547 domain-containing protein [Sanyastnella coralliicola]|uniref:DUF547 domain-containing protein n=1 Tax=Sanyastnella coralliicola TaxID=3069118 RepID=UPI0027BA9A2D|nr:DUF547 domain-containing protein [Longitalea sp. SCSIO 12813]